MNVIDLFSGPGGLTLGFKWAGFDSVLAVEFTKQAAETFRLNHHGNIINKDIRDVGFEEVDKILKGKTIDVVTGGPPCEGFSMAGKRNPIDERNNLFMQLIRFADRYNPRLVLMENVPSLLTMKNSKGKVIEQIRSEFKKIGYETDYAILKAVSYGVPQNRKRLILIATKDYSCKEIIDKLNTIAKQEVNVRMAFSDLPKLKSGEASLIYLKPPQNLYQKYLRQGLPDLTLHKSVNHRPKIIARYSYIKEGKGIKDAWDDIPEEFRPKVLYSSRGRRLHRDKPSHTVTAHVLDELLHPTEDRALTPREAARLQSFPDSYIFTGPQVLFHGSHELDMYEQIGDAVPPLMAFEIAKVVKKYLK